MNVTTSSESLTDRHRDPGELAVLQRQVAQLYAIHPRIFTTPTGGGAYPASRHELMAGVLRGASAQRSIATPTWPVDEHSIVDGG